jgi:release factor glutamine methyltransferase
MGFKIQTIQDIKAWFTGELKGFYPETEINAFINIILKKVGGSSKLNTLAFPETRLTTKQSRDIMSICRQLRTGKPLQYILGETNFYNLIIKVNNHTLIPRPETEELVDHIIKENKGFRGTIVDAGTGTGCIAISLAVNLPGVLVSGFDISEEAITTAKENARINNAHVSFFKTDILNPDLYLFSKADILVSNPPYVTESEKRLMNRNVLDFEPHTALFVPDNDPLVFYRALINLAELILVPEGRVYFEINETMGSSLLKLLDSNGYLRAEIIKDINGKDRIIKGTRHGW